MTPQNPARLIRLPEVIHRTGISRANIYVQIKEGNFPRQRQVTAKSVAWPEHEIDAWIAARIAA